MKRSVKIALASVGVVAAAAATSAAVTKILVDTALNRSEPKVMKRARSAIAGTKGNDLLTPELRAQIAAGSELLRSRVTETPVILSRDGVSLTAHWCPHPSPKRIILAMHGWRSSWDFDFSLVSSFWYDNECSVLYPDQRAQNASGGEYMAFGLLERYDCLDWLNWLQEHAGPDVPIYLAGVSMGAATVLMTADLALPDRVHGIMADCGFTSPDAIWQHIAQNNLHLPYAMNRRLVDDMVRRRISGFGRQSTVDALKKTRVPVLLIHGTEDHFVPVEMTYQNYVACASPKRLLVVPGADHGMSYLVDRPLYQSTTLAFWRDFD
ncbi:MAG: alpha/beta hydrolase [Oscillospiraceae bacterium]|nr:alpha/beta hydrolase [Oscillospiraceae bacterium]